MGISRLALWSELSAISVVEPILLDAYQCEAEQEWREGGQAPHGQPWFTSLHASSFPGEDESACGRAALYGLMDIPEQKPREGFLSAWFGLGTALEHDWVRKFAAQGRLLSKDVTGADDFQTGFEDPEHWLTGSADAIILPAFWRKSHVCEVKTTSHEKLLAMRADPRDTVYSHEKYIRQLKTYIGLANEAPFAPKVTLCAESWAVTVGIAGLALRWCPAHESFFCATREVQLDPPDDGTLIYSSREEPLTTASYYVELDREHMRAGREKLARWRDHFQRGELPPHPMEGQRKMWTSPVCAYCRFKAVGCKKDYEAGVDSLADSHTIEHATEVRRSYDYEQTRRVVLGRWGAEDLSVGRVAA